MKLAPYDLDGVYACPLDDHLWAKCRLFGHNLFLGVTYDRWIINQGKENSVDFPDKMIDSMVRTNPNSDL